MLFPGAAHKNIWPGLIATEECILQQHLPILLHNTSHLHIHPTTRGIGLLGYAIWQFGIIDVTRFRWCRYFICDDWRYLDDLAIRFGTVQVYRQDFVS